MQQTGHRSSAVRAYKRPDAEHDALVSAILQPPVPKQRKPLLDCGNLLCISAPPTIKCEPSVCYGISPQSYDSTPATAAMVNPSIQPAPGITATQCISSLPLLGLPIQPAPGTTATQFILSLPPLGLPIQPAPGTTATHSLPLHGLPIQPAPATTTTQFIPSLPPHGLPIVMNFNFGKN